MGFLLSKSKTEGKITSHDRAVLDLKVQRDRLKQYQIRIQQVTKRETDVARELLKKGYRDRAKLALKRRKHQEQLLENSEKHLMNIEQLIDSVEFAVVEKRVFDGLKEGTNLLKELQSEMSVDAVEKLLLDTREAMDAQTEITELISESLSPEAEQEAEEELAVLQNTGEEKFLEEMPEIPHGEIKQQEEKEPVSERRRVVREKEALAY